MVYCWNKLSKVYVEKVERKVHITSLPKLT